jgi:hypothetical protein
MQQITDHPRRDVLTSRKQTIDQKTNASLAEFPDTLRFKDRKGRPIDRGRDELERRRRDAAAREPSHWRQWPPRPRIGRGAMMLCV